MKTTVKDRQTLADIGLQSCGTTAAALETAINNGRSVSEELSDGETLETGEASGGRETQIVKLYAAEGVEPATAISDEDRAACPYGGIGFMGIEIDFVVS